MEVKLAGKEEEGKGGREEAREEKEGSSTMLSMGGERKDTWAEVAAVDARGNCKRATSVKSLGIRTTARKAMLLSSHWAKVATASF